MRMRRPLVGLPDARRAAGLAALALVGAGGAIVGLRSGLWSSGVPTLDAAPLDRFFDPSELADSRVYRRGLWALAIVGAPLAAVTATAVAATGRRWRPVVVRVARGRTWRAGVIFGAGLAGVTAAVALPVAAARFAWGRTRGPVTQDTLDWLLDVGKAVGIQMLLAGAAGAIAAVLIARSPRLWWMWLAALIAAFAYAASLLAPLVIEPLFQRTEPLRDPELRARVLQIAERSGVPARDVRVNDASARTTAANAYVSGFGASRRIVLYDTLIEELPREQVEVVVAHELAHVAHGHVVKGSTWGAVLALPASLMMFAAVGWRAGFSRAPRGPAGTDLVVRRLAIAAATAAVLGFVGTPLGSWVSRAYEAEAEWSALRATRDPAAAIGLQRQLVLRNRSVPDTPAAIQIWFGTHPTALQRIGLAQQSARERS